MKYKGFKKGVWTGILDSAGHTICQGDEIIDLATNVSYTVDYNPNMAAFTAVSGETKIPLYTLKTIIKKNKL